MKHRILVYLILFLLLVAVSTYYWLNQPRVLFSAPRCADDLRMCELPTISQRIIFDTGSGLNVMPQNLIKPLQELGLITQTLDIDANIRFITGLRKHFDVANVITIPFSEQFSQEIAFVESGPTEETPLSLLMGLSFLDRYVLWYDRETIQLLTRAPRDYDLIIPIRYNEEDRRYYVKAKVNGIEHEFLIDTGMGGISLPLADTCYATGTLNPVTESLFIDNEPFISYGIEEEHGEVRIGSVIRHPTVFYCDENVQDYYLNPTQTGHPTYIDFKKRVLGIKTK